ncbi:unnamed protein product [Lactuca virosa]|uniref:Uncharacterized protein n=1 Tax=Lactuca virosa TaxID=75947 RepID=A0AAU9P3J5_9ASTR|nr:unnamed protein product [Lactuca virosa]
MKRTTFLRPKPKVPILRGVPHKFCSKLCVHRETTDGCSLWIVGHFYLMNGFSFVEITVQAFGRDNRFCSCVSNLCSLCGSALQRKGRLCWGCHVLEYTHTHTFFALSGMN